MTINEKKQLSNYIKGLVRESLGEMDSMPNWWNDKYRSTMDFDDEDFEEGHYDDELEGDEELEDLDVDDAPVYADEPDDDEPAGLDELRQLAESYARQSVRQILSEKKGGWKKKGKGGKKGSKKSKGEKKKSSSEKTLMDHLNNDSVNAAHYYYKLYGAKSDAEKAAARSLGYKKAKGEKTPNKRSHYRFTPKERNKLNAMLTADNN